MVLEEYQIGAMRGAAVAPEECQVAVQCERPRWPQRNAKSRCNVEAVVAPEECQAEVRRGGRGGPRGMPSRGAMRGGRGGVRGRGSVSRVACLALSTTPIVGDCYYHVVRLSMLLFLSQHIIINNLFFFYQ